MCHAVLSDDCWKKKIIDRKLTSSPDVPCVTVRTLWIHYSMYHIIYQNVFSLHLSIPTPIRHCQLIIRDHLSDRHCSILDVIDKMAENQYPPSCIHRIFQDFLNLCSHTDQNSRNWTYFRPRAPLVLSM